MKYCNQLFLVGAVAILLAGCGREDGGEPSPRKVEPPKQPLDYHALVIGIADYSGTGWPQLGTARNDAEAMGDVLRNQYGFRVTQLTDAEATRGNILRQLDQFMDLTDHDALLIYFAGHGYFDKKMDEGYWIPHGAKRERERLPAKEDWLWTTSISKVLDALPARHVLVVADTCYGGSLFRGEDDTEKAAPWYRRAIDAPSRYLLTSGNLEPVLDSGIRHSVFAQEILNFLQFSEMEVFAASDIGHAIRHKVTDLTGQLVRMGTLVSPADAGGEFVFVRNEAAFPEPIPETAQATDSVVRADYGNPAQELAERIETYAENLKDAFVRPRILACIGPTDDKDEEKELVRTRLHSHLHALGGCILVERDSFGSLLHEIELGSSRQADARAATEIGKLLPASLVLFWETTPVGDHNEIHARVVESETSRVIASTFESYSSAGNLDGACAIVSRKIMVALNQARPTLIPVRIIENDKLTAGWGRFHGAREGEVFELVLREAAGTVSQRDIPVGTAQLLSASEESGVFEASLDAGAPGSATNLYLRATL